MLCWAIGMFHRKRGGKFVKDLRCVKFTMQKGDNNGRFAKPTARGREQTKLSIELGKDGVAQCKVEDVKDNCAIRERVVNVTCEGNQITLVVHHKERFEVLADCICMYDVDFKMSKLSQGNYHLKVYYAGSVVKYDKEQLVYDGEIRLVSGKVTQVTLRSGVPLPVD